MWNFSLEVTVAYIRINDGAQSTVSMIFAKVRLSPSTSITIPRLELIATLIGTRLSSFIRREPGLRIRKSTLWPDSECVLQWIRSQDLLSVFVQNRIKEIRALEGLNFRYVPTKENPADVGSRGCTMKGLVEPNWNKGPPWLTELEENWPESRLNLSPESLELALNEVRKYSLWSNVMMGPQIEETPMEIDSGRYSSLNKLLRVTAICLLFLERLRRLTDRTLPVCTTDLERARLIWDKSTQRTSFSDTISNLRSGKTDS